MGNCFNVMEITKFLILAFCHGNHGGSKEEDVICHLWTWFFLIEEDAFAVVKTELMRRSPKSQAQNFPEICDCMFHQIQNSGVHLRKAMLCSLPTRKDTQLGSNRVGLIFFPRLLRQPSSNPLTFISGQWFEFLMWKAFFGGMGLSSPLQTQNKCNWLLLPFPSPHNLFFWFLV